MSSGVAPRNSGQYANNGGTPPKLGDQYRISGFCLKISQVSAEQDKGTAGYGVSAEQDKGTAGAHSTIKAQQGTE